MAKNLFYRDDILAQPLGNKFKDYLSPNDEITIKIMIEFEDLLDYGGDTTEIANEYIIGDGDAWFEDCNMKPVSIIIDPNPKKPNKIVLEVKGSVEFGEDFGED